MRLGWRKTFIAPTPKARRAAMRRRYNDVDLAAPEDIRRYRDELELLADLLPESCVNWYLEGGMALAAHLGQFKRKHSDVDVGVFVHDVKTFEERLAERNYRLFLRNPRLQILEYTRFDVVRVTSAEIIRSGKRVKRLTAIQVDDRGRIKWNADLLPRFDVHVHHEGPDVVYVTHRRFEFPADLFQSASVYETPQLRKIQLASIPFIYYFKLIGNRPTQRYDRQLIEQSGLISASTKERVEQILGRAS